MSTIPKYLYAGNMQVPIYLKRKSVNFIDNPFLPDNIEWDRLTKIMYEIGDYKKAIDWLIKNKRPVILLYEGKSGEGKTTIIINDLKYFLKKYSKIDLTPINFNYYFLLGREISLDPRFIRRKYKKKNFIVVDEANLMLNKYRAVSIQNRDANQFADMMRQAQIFLMLTAITQQQLDSDFVNYKIVFRVITEYNDQRNKKVYYRVQYNAHGITHDSKRYWDYFDYQKNQVANWCDKDLYKASLQLKYKKGYGDSPEAFVTDKEEKKQQEEMYKSIEADKIVDKYDDVDQIVAALYNINTRRSDIIEAVNLKFGEKVIDYDKIRPIWHRAKKKLIKLDDDDV